MSVYYGGPPTSGAGYAPPGRVNFGWIGEAFELFKANAGLWIIAGLMLIVVPGVISGIIGGIVGATSVLHPHSGGRPPFGSGTGGFGRSPYDNGLPVGLNIAIQMGSLVYTSFLYGGIYRVAVKQVRGERTDIADIFSGGPLFLNMLGFTLLYALAAGMGTLLCILPGLLVGGLMLPAYALVADGEGVMNAVTRSIDGMKRDMWNAALFVVVMGLLVLASYLAFCLGEFVTMPMFWLVSALAYRDMIGMPGPGIGPQGGMPQAPGSWPPPPSAPQTPPWSGQPPSSGNTP